MLYFKSYIVVDPGDTKLKEQDLLTDEEFRKKTQELGDTFKAGIGAEAVRELLRIIDLDSLAKELRTDIRKTDSQLTKVKLINKLRIVEAFRKSGNKPDWMIMDVIPVLPPDLRPFVPLGDGRFATSDLNDLYRRVINRNNRLKRLMELKAPRVIIRNEKSMLQEAVDALFDNGRRSRVLKAATKRPLKSLSQMLMMSINNLQEKLKNPDRDIKYFDYSFAYLKLYRGETISNLKDCEKSASTAEIINEMFFYMTALGLDQALSLLESDMSQSLKFLHKIESVFLPSIRLIDRGIVLFRKRLYEEAIRTYDKILEIDPENSEAIYMKANCLFNLKRYDDAIIYYDKMPHSYDALIHKGLALRYSGKYSEALCTFEEAIENHSDCHYAWISKGATFSDMGCYSDAITCYDKALEIDPNDFNDWNQKLLVYCKSGEYEEARSCIRKIQDILPQDANGWFLKGYILEKIRNIDIDVLVKIHANTALAEIFVKQSLENIGYCYDMATKLNPDFVDAWHNKGIHLYFRGGIHRKKAITCFNIALKIDPANANIWYSKAFVQDEIYRRTGAYLSFKKFIELSPQNMDEKVQYSKDRIKALKQ